MHTLFLIEFVIYEDVKGLQINGLNVPWNWIEDAECVSHVKNSQTHCKIDVRIDTMCIDVIFFSMPVKNMSIASYQQFSSFFSYRAFRWFGIRMNSICQRFSASRVATQESNDRQTPSFVFDPIQLPMGVCYLILSHSLFSIIISHFNRLRHKSSVLHFSQRLNAKKFIVLLLKVFCLFGEWWRLLFHFVEYLKIYVY